MPSVCISSHFVPHTVWLCYTLCYFKLKRALQANPCSRATSCPPTTTTTHQPRQRHALYMCLVAGTRLWLVCTARMRSIELQRLPIMAHAPHCGSPYVPSKYGKSKAPVAKRLRSFIAWMSFGAGRKSYVLAGYYCFVLFFSQKKSNGHFKWKYKLIYIIKGLFS